MRIPFPLLHLKCGAGSGKRGTVTLGERTPLHCRDSLGGHSVGWPQLLGSLLAAAFLLGLRCDGDSGSPASPTAPQSTSGICLLTATCKSSSSPKLVDGQIPWRVLVWYLDVTVSPVICRFRGEALLPFSFCFLAVQRPVQMDGCLRAACQRLVIQPDDFFSEAPAKLGDSSRLLDLSVSLGL